MSTNFSKKEAYTSPATRAIDIVPMGSLLQVISNPGGDVPPIDPNEG